MPSRWEWRPGEGERAARVVGGERREGVVVRLAGRRVDLRDEAGEFSAYLSELVPPERA